MEVPPAIAAHIGRRARAILRPEAFGIGPCFQKLVAFLAEGRGIPYRVISAETNKPAEQKDELNQLDQLLLRTDRVEDLQEWGLDQPLRRNGSTTEWRIERIKDRKDQ